MTAIYPEEADLVAMAEAAAQTIFDALAERDLKTGEIYAQAGADALMAWLVKHGRIIPDGQKARRVKSVRRDDRGQIIAVVEELELGP